MPSASAIPPRWLSSPDWAVPAVVLTGIWTIGGGAIIYLAGLQNIPPHLYEAAELDGAGALARFRHITLPMLSPTLFFVFITTLIGAFQVFDVAFVLGGSRVAAGTSCSTSSTSGTKDSGTADTGMRRRSPWCSSPCAAVVVIVACGSPSGSSTTRATTGVTRDERRAGAQRPAASGVRTRADGSGPARWPCSCW